MRTFGWSLFFTKVKVRVSESETFITSDTPQQNTEKFGPVCAGAVAWRAFGGTVGEHGTLV